MQVIIAPDSFKGCLDADDVARALSAGVRHVFPDADIVELPLSDGGEGFARIAARALAPQAQPQESLVADVFGRPHAVTWYLDGHRAFCDAASVIGLESVPDDERDPLRATSFGVGELLLSMIDAGATHVLLGLGGVATNDGGWGALSALGAELLDADNNPLAANPAEFAKVASVNLDHLDPRIGGLQLDLAADVDAVLTGPRGASHVFGPQKGATPEDVVELDTQLGRLAALADVDHERPGDGAAGGLGWALTRFAQGQLISGALLVMEASAWDQLTLTADLLLTGEGRYDRQSTMGKLTGTLIADADEVGLPVRIFTGRSDVDDPCVVVITPPDMPTAQAYAQAAELLTRAAADVAATFAQA